jgi:hypothetical protein
MQAGLVAWAVMAGSILAFFAREVVPTSYLWRPLMVAGLVALPIAGIALLAGRRSNLAAALVSVGVVHPGVAVFAALVSAAVTLYLRIRRRPSTLSSAVMAVAVTFLTVGVVRSIPNIELPSVRDGGVARDGQPIYILLLDGYPRIDSLAEAGIDNGGFFQELEQRDFDHYPAARSETGWTELTLTTMLTDETVGTDPTSNSEKRRLRTEWRLPPGFIAVDPPLGFVTLPGVPHVSPIGVTDFEAHLLGSSLAGLVAPDWVRRTLGMSVRAQHEFALAQIATMDATRVFAHIAAPHPPFVFSTDEGADCWPGCHLWKTNSASLMLTREEWTDAMAAQIKELNGRLLATIDQIVTRRPDAVIVLFSDHGMRENREDQTEWLRILLAGRTPDHSMLFEDAPTPGAMMRLVLETYAAP